MIQTEVKETIKPEVCEGIFETAAICSTSSNHLPRDIDYSQPMAPSQEDACVNACNDGQYEDNILSAFNKLTESLNDNQQKYLLDEGIPKACPKMVRFSITCWPPETN